MVESFVHIQVRAFIGIGGVDSLLQMDSSFVVRLIAIEKRFRQTLYAIETWLGLCRRENLFLQCYKMKFNPKKTFPNVLVKSQRSVVMGKS